MGSDASSWESRWQHDGSQHADRWGGGGRGFKTPGCPLAMSTASPVDEDLPQAIAGVALTPSLPPPSAWPHAAAPQPHSPPCPCVSFPRLPLPPQVTQRMAAENARLRESLAEMTSAAGERDSEYWK